MKARRLPHALALALALALGSPLASAGGAALPYSRSPALAVRALDVAAVRARTEEATELTEERRYEEAMAKLFALTTDPKFELFADGDAGRAATFALGDVLAKVGAFDPARAAFRKLLVDPSALSRGDALAQRAVKRIVDIGLEAQREPDAARDLEALSLSASPEIQGELAYVKGRAAEAEGDAGRAAAEYAKVGPASRFWASATYLRGLLAVERGALGEGEALFCKVADPKRSPKSTPVFGDARFFAVRDLARLALGRVAHEERRFDDARYYYFLVPRDSDRLAEAMYESATSRYERKDYEGARLLLAELAAMPSPHAYEDEAHVLLAYVALAQCRFKEADHELAAFLRRYEPVHAAARRLLSDPAGARFLFGKGTAVGMEPEMAATLVSLVRTDPETRAVSLRLELLTRQAAGADLVARALPANGTGAAGPGLGDDPVDATIAATAREVTALEAAGAKPEATRPLREALARIEQQATPGGGLTADAPLTGDVGPRLLRVKEALAEREEALTRETVARIERRLGRLLRRARLARVETVLGKKRALEVEIEGLENGVLPRSALDSLDAARTLKDSEEYWPFEGEAWSDEIVGGEGLR